MLQSGKAPKSWPIGIGTATSGANYGKSFVTICHTNSDCKVSAWHLALLTNSPKVTSYYPTRY